MQKHEVDEGNEQIYCILCRELNVLGGIYCYGFDFKKLYVKKYVKWVNQ